MRRIDQPETLNEARSHQTMTSLYVADGICMRCAAQLAYGHQLGFLALESKPCPTCQPIIAGLPKSQPNEWRSVDGRADRPADHLDVAPGTPSEAVQGDLMLTPA